jgi:hypothetical protein
MNPILCLLSFESFWEACVYYVLVKIWVEGSEETRAQSVADLEGSAYC